MFELNISLWNRLRLPAFSNAIVPRDDRMRARRVCHAQYRHLGQRLPCRAADRRWRAHATDRRWRAHAADRLRPDDGGGRGAGCPAVAGGIRNSMSVYRYDGSGKTSAGVYTNQRCHRAIECQLTRDNAFDEFHELSFSHLDVHSVILINHERIKRNDPCEKDEPAGGGPVGRSGPCASSGFWYVDTLTR